MDDWQVIQLNLERGWFPRAVPPADGLRAARCPGELGWAFFANTQEYYFEVWVR
jgi:hypothetical protein